MKISNLRVESSTDTDGRNLVFVKADIESEVKNPKYEFPKTMWFSTLKEYSTLLTCDRMDAFLVAMLIPAIRNGESRILIDGKLSAKLYDNLGKLLSLLKFYLLRFPDSNQNKFEVIAKSYDSKPIHTNVASATGYSGGVDSLYAMYEYHFKAKIDDFKLKFVTLFNVGATLVNHADFDKIDKEFWNRYDVTKTFAKKEGLDCLPLDSNIVKFHVWAHITTHSVTASAAALMFQNAISRYYFASAGYTIEEIFSYSYYTHYFLHTKDTAIFDIILLPLLSTDTFEIISQGAELTRMEKVEKICDYELAQNSMSVCVRPVAGEKNCGKCPKCQRTLLALDLLDKIEKFSNVFDIISYKKSVATKRYVARQLISKKSDLYAK